MKIKLDGNIESDEYTTYITIKKFDPHLAPYYTKEITRDVIVDYDLQGNICGIEIIAPISDKIEVE